MNEVHIVSSAAREAKFETNFEITARADSDDAGVYRRMIGTNARVKVSDVAPAVDGLYSCVSAVTDGSLIVFTFSKKWSQA